MSPEKFVELNEAVESNVELNEAVESNFEASEAAAANVDICGVIHAATPLLKVLLWIPFFGQKTKKVIQNLIDVGEKVCPAANVVLIAKTDTATTV